MLSEWGLAGEDEADDGAWESGCGEGAHHQGADLPALSGVWQGLHTLMAPQGTLTFTPTYTGKS